MRNLEEFEKDIENIKKELEELKKVEKAKKGRWKPEINKEYWFIKLDRTIVSYVYNNDKIDNGIIKYNQIFKTFEEAEKYLKYKNALNEAIYEFNQEEWEDCKTKKYYIYYNYKINKISITFTWTYRVLGLQYFKTREDAEKFADKHKKQILKYEFGIEEE